MHVAAHFRTLYRMLGPRFLLFSLIIVLIFVSTLSAEPNVRDAHQSYQEWVSSHSFPYEIGNERKQEIIVNYPKLKLGLDKKHVEQLLGSPDVSTPTGPKKRQAGSTGDGYTGSTWDYYFQKVDPRLSNRIKDISVCVFFDHNAKVESVVPNGVPSLKAIESAYYGLRRIAKDRPFTVIFYTRAREFEISGTKYRAVDEKGLTNILKRLKKRSPEAEYEVVSFPKIILVTQEKIAAAVKAAGVSLRHFWVPYSDLIGSEHDSGPYGGGMVDIVDVKRP